MKNDLVALLAAALVLIGCQTSNAGDKPNLKAGIDRCIKSYAFFPLSLKEELRTFMGVSKDRAPALFCQRLGRAVASGRITFSDINRLQESRSTDIWRVIKGR
ncbi:hypothetical protein [Mesorhizobium retamae]|uniref:Lipoprotein n=1 Tax=Mesorhizobium retamae TaxID=2912854 RepID=A0ABS9QAA2_9HYPH|nr:hypothetical protein [Mesorhizobium sp. IRAMC:0171]MCG7504333.1 hypothetical protein [Mesorhizobium sp. IRAMC:0171]